ncbi:MAG: hypothetical protein E6G97_22820 [Alphaproteobacteria bacterium]|nr:MAG: hypothetical protein E6G97_22820 [Alphaproteobacteria bacterium]
MSYANPIWLEGRRKYWTRPDAYRFAPPGSPEAKMPGWIDPWMTRVRAKEAAEDAAAEQEEFEREVLALRHDFAKLKLEYELRCFQRKYSPDQQRSPKGNPDGGQWTSGSGGSHPANGDASQSGEGLAQDRRSMIAPGSGQEPRRDLLDLDAIAKDPRIRARIDEAWAASDPNGFGREHGFWISRNDATGELFTRPFFNPGGPATIVPGAPPSDAIASFHTHPARPEFGGYPGPSLEDEQYAARTGLPGLLQSHIGMYYFGPLLRPRRSP